MNTKSLQKNVKQVELYKSKPKITYLLIAADGLFGYRLIVVLTHVGGAFSSSVVFIYFSEPNADISLWIIIAISTSM